MAGSRLSRGDAELMEVLVMVPVLAQLFPDIGGFLLGPQFLSLVADLVSAFLISVVSTFLGGFFAGM